jgi:RNA polymerase sigma factor (sigma-70 family)
MLKLWKATVNHEDLFIERYERLFGWSLKLTAHDRQLAEDLLHDVFVQFTLRRPDLNTIHDLDGYLFAMLRNSHVSYVRRVPFVRTTPLSMAEYDSLEIGLRATDVRDQIKVQDELRLICHYAALRKETSKAGSVLILRFFHGYYPSEIAQILRSKLDTVRKWLQLARNEAKVYLESPEALSFIRETSQKTKVEGGFARASEELLRDLRQIIFASREGDCFSRKQLRELYASTHSETVEGQTLAHLVSCANDLDQVNALLNLPLLNERFPTDMTGNDRGSGGGPSGPMSLGGGSRGRGAIKRSLRRVKETFEHYPKELRIAVNGYVQVSQRISSDLMEQTLSLDLEEKVGFVEVFSEQWVRLFFLNVDPPPDGAFEQQAHIDFSEGRSLKASLDFTGPCPNLQVVYHDPTQTAEASVESLESEGRIETVQSPKSKVQSPADKGLGFIQGMGAIGVRVARRVRDIRHRTLDIGLLLRPGVVTAFVALLLIAVVLFIGSRHSLAPLSASVLLAQSVTAEEAIAARTDQVLHRTINLEEKNSAGATVSRRRVEVWHSAERGVTVRRIYDEQSQLVAGDWRRADGVETLYAHGVKPQIQPAPAKRGSIALNFSNAWQQDLTAQDFSALVRNTQGLAFDENADTYRLTYQNNNLEGLRRAILVISHTDLHAIEQTLTVRQGSEERSYHYLETSFERRPISAVAPVVFEPDAVLVSSSEPGARNSKPELPDVSPLPSSPISPAASAALEMEVVRLLDQAGAFGGDQISVSRTPEGALLVEGVLDTVQRKRELINALTPVSRNPALKIRIETQEDAMARHAKQKSGVNPSEITLDQVQIETKVPPAYAELRKYFTARGLGGEQIQRECNSYADLVLGHSMRARQQARALRQLAGRFSQEELRMLDDESRAKWRAMILQHARVFQREAEGLRRKLEPAFAGSAASESVADINNDAELVKAIERLFSLWGTVDADVRQTFSIASSGEASIAVKRPQFWQSLKTAESLAAGIANHR